MWLREQCCTIAPGHSRLWQHQSERLLCAPPGAGITKRMLLLGIEDQPYRTELADTCKQVQQEVDGPAESDADRNRYDPRHNDAPGDAPAHG